MLTLYRRHLDTCPQRDRGRSYVKCPCPIHCDGFVSGRRVRQSMNTVNWSRATRRMAELEEQVVGGKVQKSVADATEAFLSSRNIEPTTARKYRMIAQRLLQFAKRRDIGTVERITLEDLDAYRATRKLNALSWSKELQVLRTFFSFCQKRKWCDENPAKDMEMPSNPKPRPREPYTREEISKIVAACDSFGKAPYERLRARAMVLLFWRYGLRISDVATLQRAHIRNGQIFLHALKNGQMLWMPLTEDVKFALEVVPLPTGAPVGGQYYFWTGFGDIENHIKTVDRSLRQVFRKSGVEHASAHRFRHTLATAILVKGGTLEDAANILGDSPAIIRKHYAKWSTDYQHRTVSIIRLVHGTPAAHEENSGASPLVSTVFLVPGVGIEPTLTLR